MINDDVSGSARTRPCHCSLIALLFGTYGNWKVGSCISGTIYTPRIKLLLRTHIALLAAENIINLTALIRTNLLATYEAHLLIRVLIIHNLE